jgi:hypothetical protein
LKITDSNIDKDVIGRLNKVDIKSWIKVIYDAKSLLFNQVIKPLLKIVAPHRTIRRGSVVGELAQSPVLYFLLT